VSSSPHPPLEIASLSRTGSHLEYLQERKAAVIRAEGESESARLISDATKAAGGGMIELRRIEAAKDIAGQLAKSGNVVYLPSGNNMLLGVNTR
jgi:prohibitin 1